VLVEREFMRYFVVDMDRSCDYFRKDAEEEEEEFVCTGAAEAANEAANEEDGFSSAPGMSMGMGEGMGGMMGMGMGLPFEPEPSDDDADDEPLCSLGGPSFAFTPPSDFINPPLDPTKSSLPAGPDCSDPAANTFWMDMCTNLDAKEAPEGAEDSRQIVDLRANPEHNTYVPNWMELHTHTSIVLSRIALSRIVLSRIVLSRIVLSRTQRPAAPS